MSLLSANMTAFCVMTPTRTPDNQSGNNTTWTEGTAFQACAVPAQSRMQAAKSPLTQHAAKPDPDPEFTVFTERAVLLPFHTVIKRRSDGKVFRITSDPAETAAPNGAQLNLRMHAAEKYRITGTIIPAPAPPEPEPPEPEPSQNGSDPNDQS